ncbi:MAG: uracil-DNA glycosylase family protein [Gemmatimonadaceae bacterium]
MSSGRTLPVALAEHAAALAGCRRCGHDIPDVVPILSQARAPRVMLVGQAPGKTEVGDRRPFAGRAGKTLFRWLERAGVTEAEVRERVYIAAITRCYPGPSASGRGDRVPSPRERALCAGWLEAEIRLLRPVLLILVGRLAIDRFIGALPLERVVGRAHQVDLAAFGVPDTVTRAIPLPHPSGASTWPNLPGNRVLLDEALALLGAAFAEAWAPSDARGTRRSA